MRIKSNVKAGAITANHNQGAARGPKAKTNVKACALTYNHGQCVKRGMRVKSGVKAGVVPEAPE